MKKIALIGAPASGKTTIAAGLFYNLKILGKKVEVVPELIKHKVYQNLSFGADGFDIQNTLEQKALEENLQKAPNLEFLICEAPLCNGFFYSSFYKKKEEWPILEKIAAKGINSYDLIIFVKHNIYKEDFETFGRKEDKKTALLLEKHIAKKIKSLKYTGPIVTITQATNIQNVLYSILDPQSYLSKKES